MAPMRRIDPPGPRRGAHAAAPRMRPPALLMGLVACAYLLVQLALAPAAQVYPDTARYGAMALEYLGVPRAAADAAASAMLCADRSEQAARRNAAANLPGPQPDPVVVARDCNSEADGQLVFDNPRYDAIFATRPGYPLAVAALSPLVGLKVALWAVPVAATAAAGVLLWRLLRLAGASAGVAVAGQALLYVCPAGWWGSQMLTEGPTLVGVVAALLGAVLLVQGRVRGGAGVLVAGLGVVAAVKYSTAIPLAAALAAAAVAGLLVARPLDRRGAWVLAVVDALTAAGLLVAGRLLGWPSLEDTVQDLFALHFTLPDVPHPLHRLLVGDLAYWRRWAFITPRNLALLAGGGVGVWALWRRWRPLALIAASTAVTGVALASAHPDVLEGDRLYSLAWLVVAIGVPLAAHRASPRQPAAAEWRGGGEMRGVGTWGCGSAMAGARR